MICQQKQARSAISDVLGIGVLFLTLLALTACQTERTVSLEEAKQITATFDDSTFTPPPRTISDITEFLDKHATTGSEALKAMQVRADSEPPAGVSGPALGKFYLVRAEAARLLGRHRQGITDATKAIALKVPRPRPPLIVLQTIHEELGNYAEAAEFARRSLNHSGSSGESVFDNGLLSIALAYLGDFEGAAAACGRMQNKMPETYNWTSAWGPYAQAFGLIVEGQNHHIMGKHSDAEAKFRKAVTDIEDQIAGGYGENEPSYAGGTVGDKRRMLKAYALRLLASSLAGQGRLAEAEVAARDAVIGQLRHFGRYSGQTVEGLGALTEVLGEQGRYEEAATLARVTVEIYERMGAGRDSATLAVARQTLAEAYVGMGRWDEALNQFSLIKAGLEADLDTFQRRFASNLSWSVAWLETGRTDEAMTVAQLAYRHNQRLMGAKHYNTAASQGVLAMVLAKLGKHDEALAAFSQAVPTLLSRSRGSDGEATNQAARGKRVGMILESYIDLLSSIRGTAIEQTASIDAAAEAFRIADVARSRFVQQALGASSARAAAKDPALANLVRREQDTIKQISSLYGLLANILSAPTGQQDSQTIASLRVRIDDLRVARGALSEEIENGFPEYAQLINPKPMTIEQTRAILTTGEALISTYVGRERTYVWAVPRQGEASFAAVELGREDLSDEVYLLRGALEPNAATLGDIPEFDVESAYALYEQLLAPVEAGWKDATSLLVVGHGPLGFLPLSVLPTKSVTLEPESEPLFRRYNTVPWLARSHAVTMLPSVSSLKALRGLPAGRAARRAFAGFGDPWFNREQAAAAAAEQEQQVAALTTRGLTTRGLPVSLRAAPKTQDVDSAELADLPRLPDTADEVRSIAMALNADVTKSVFVGRNASETTVKQMDLSGIKVLAFATHGLVPGDLNGLLQPALALSSPKVVGGKDDGLLTMGEILALKLDADWVVLSACNTGSGQGAGAEAVSGLGRAFFYAGTRALLVSNWPVESTSAKALITDLFSRQAKDPSLDRAEALRQAMSGLIDGKGYVDPKSGKTVFSYAHPLFWAPFSLIGDGGGGEFGS